MANSEMTLVDGVGPFASINTLNPPNKKVFRMLHIAIFITCSNGKMPTQT